MIGVASHGMRTRSWVVERISGPVLTTTLGILISLVPVTVLLWHRQLPNNPEVFRYLLLSELFSAAITSGAWYPRWLPDLNGGYGYPLFVFYQPGYFYVSHVLSFVSPPVLRCALTLSVVALAGGMGAYCLIRCFLSRGASLLLLLMFQLTPYHFTEIYGRGDLSEWIVLQLSPWPLYFLYRLARTPADGRAHPWFAIGLGLAVTSVTYAHPVACVFFLPALVVMGGVLGLSVAPGDKLAFFTRAFLGLLIGVTLSAPYWLTVLTMKGHVNIQATVGGHYDPLAHLLSPLAFFRSDADALSRRLGLSFELGPVHFLLALVGVWCGRRRPFVLAAFVIYVAFLLLMTPASASAWSHYPLYLMQFPWRLLAVTAIFQLICMLGVAELNRKADRKEVVVAVTMVIVAGLWHAGVWTFKPMPPNVLESANVRRVIAASFPAGVGFVPLDLATPKADDVRIAAANARHALPLSPISTFDVQEWMPITALGAPPRTSRGEPLLEVLAGAASIVPGHASSRFRLDYAIDASVASTILVNQLYLPGWRVTVNGRDFSDATLREQVRPDGRIAVITGPGRYRLQAWYDGPPGWRARSVVMLVVIGGCLLWLFRPSRAR
ncbi:MAG TPA: 6-pyruvoyl-tetrahydropterin synthase-related protein [Candidatus Acidoferrum sp.]|nr:6-pyruvoyl-tetrahydropterin synthase-related protein [Candidatus Acidoferrum sp.]